MQQSKSYQLFQPNSWVRDRVSMRVGGAGRRAGLLTPPDRYTSRLVICVVAAVTRVGDTTLGLLAAYTAETVHRQIAG